MREYNISFDQVKLAMELKDNKNGAFNDRLFLISVDEKDKERE